MGTLNRNGIIPSLSRTVCPKFWVVQQNQKDDLVPKVS